VTSEAEQKMDQQKFDQQKFEESASQLSAMFDGELSAAECELLSRRLARDETLRTRWARYALVGAAMRAEPMAAVSSSFASRVGAAIDARDHAPGIGGAASGFRRLRTVALGAALAAGVAGAAVFVLRNEMLARDQVLSAYTPVSQRVATPANQPAAAPVSLMAAARPAANNGSLEPRSYVVPPAGIGASQALPASLANYVVAHSEYSSPLTRRNLISALISSDAGELGPSAEPTEPAAVDQRSGSGAAGQGVNGAR
jgi:sigma-E factor negative regulatory protein RseA